jgi:probable rRNA maturation factor
VPKPQAKIKLRLDSNCGFDEIECSMIESLCATISNQLAKEFEWDISIVFTDHTLMKRLHKEYFADASTTDVISFPFSESNTQVEGEIYVNVEKAREQAIEFDISKKEELFRLITHGLLHLIGYRDDTQTNHELMHRKQEKILKSVHFLLAPKH